MSGKVIFSAPVLLKLANIKSWRTFQDRRLTHNNPVDLLLWECQKIWLSMTISNIVLLLVIGRKKKSDLSTMPYFQHILKDRFISRLCHLFIFFLNGEHAWKALENQLNESIKANYFWCNISLLFKEAKLDNIKQMDKLKKNFHLQPNE